MKYQRIMTVQDISCIGQCSLTVALPILSACGLETVILPSAVLSNHTAPGYHGFTFHDLTEEMPKIVDKWAEEKTTFDAVYTGYLGSLSQIETVKDIFRRFQPKLKIVDPAMADNGKLYYGFDVPFAHEMAKLCAGADYILPNISEACFMTDTEYRAEYDKKYVSELLKKLAGLGARNVILTGVGYQKDRTGIAFLLDGKESYYEHEKLSQSYHGTGDIYSSVFAGMLLQGKDAETSAQISAEFVMKSIRATIDDKDHWYGVKFETQLGWLTNQLS